MVSFQLLFVVGLASSPAQNYASHTPFGDAHFVTDPK